ncbi:hypothetical protein [Pseudomonas sp. 30_B]|uniref:hypothetical protein n=1 Tax=Pseudomonas sp. 30_B TaxID=2813575 RepID=UPI001A9FD8C7|nr:hypothetical protein [Pseudomonas sp. 30_B]
MLPYLQRTGLTGPASLDNRTWAAAWGLVLLASGLSVTWPARASDLDASDHLAAPAGTTPGPLYLHVAERDRLYRAGHSQPGVPGLPALMTPTE